MEQLIKDVNSFIEICKKLKQAGYKKKDIANVLDIPAPVLSSLLKTVLPSISQIDTGIPIKEIEEVVADAFLMVNNLSRTKIVKRLPADIVTLTNLLDNMDFKRHEKSSYLNFIRHQAEFSYNYISQYFQGVYYFYYLSSDTDQLKAEPFMIKPNIVERIVEVYKGNEQSSVRCFGIALLNNNHTINMQLAENHESPEEYMQILLSLPFIRQVEYLRGIFSNLNFARQPIARKVVLLKISDQSDYDFFNSLPVKRFSSPSDVDIPEIGRYLYAVHSKTECFAIAKPCFNFVDLDNEILVGNLG
jgi:predicted transcriptional regulator